MSPASLSSTSDSFVIPFSSSILSITSITFTSVSTSAKALCATSTSIPKLSAIIPSLNFLKCGNNSFASGKESMYVGLNSSPNWSALCLIKPISKVALCATRTVSFTKSKTFGKTLSIVSASLTISFVIFVTSTTL